jgi:hypothetical protein
MLVQCIPGVFDTDAAGVGLRAVPGYISLSNVLEDFRGVYPKVGRLGCASGFLGSGVDGNVKVAKNLPQAPGHAGSAGEFHCVDDDEVNSFTVGMMETPCLDEVWCGTHGVLLT